MNSLSKCFNKLSPRVQKFITVFVYFFVFSAAGFYFAWNSTSDLIQKAILDDFAVAEKTSLIKSSFKKFSNSGFPFSINTKIERLGLAMQSPSGDYNVQPFDFEFSCNLLISDCEFFVPNDLQVKNNNLLYFIAINKPRIRVSFNKSLLLVSLFKERFEFKDLIEYAEIAFSSVSINSQEEGDKKSTLFVIKNVDFSMGSDPFRYSLQKGKNIYYSLEIDNYTNDDFPFKKFKSKLDLRSYKVDDLDKIMIRVAEFDIDYLSLKLLGDLVYVKNGKALEPNLTLKVDNLYKLGEVISLYLLDYKPNSPEINMTSLKLENLFHSIFAQKNNLYEVKINTDKVGNVKIGKISMTSLYNEIIKIFMVRK